MSSDRELDRENEYNEILKSCVLKPGGHRQMESTADKPVRLYTVTTIAQSVMYGGMRTPVICDSFDKAVMIVEDNVGDIWEYSYMLAVIEAVIPNKLYGGIMGEQYWYRWTRDEIGGSYKAIETPLSYKNTFGFGIG